MVINVCPFIPINNDDERSAYSTLLIHTPWPEGGEDSLLDTEASAVTQLRTIIDSDCIPQYVFPMLKQQKTSTNFSENQNQLADDSVQDAELEEHEYISNDDILESQGMENFHVEQQAMTVAEGVFASILPSRVSYYRNFIQNAQIDYMDKQAIENQLSDSTDAASLTANTSVSNVKNYEERSIQLALNVAKLTKGQLSAYKKAIIHISGEDPTQLIMFISGEGGTGKSFLIELIMEFTRLKYGKQRGLYGAAVAMAPTGCAANVIKGFTWQSCYSRGRQSQTEGKEKISQQTAKKIGEKFAGTKLGVLDEISMINLESLAEISHRHRQGLLAVTSDNDERHNIMTKPFGGLHMLFTGDLWQLKAIGGHPIYSHSELKGQALEGRKIWLQINEYTELTENYRFKNDITTTLKDFLSGAREGNVDSNLLMKVNKRLVLSRQEAVRSTHPSANWIAHTKASVAIFNEADLKEKILNGAAHYRCVANHSAASTLTAHPNKETRKTLFQIQKPRGSQAFIDFAIGQRVSCIRNLGTQIGELTETLSDILHSDSSYFNAQEFLMDQKEL